ncbi:RsiV family protein [Clostridium sp. WILCCON 0269]|uniref:RsiV family protein n=1 Tax=Candidatus Clostridium eludens TaxID=3381663 RepID=A0ABW8SPM6_9CLOT
MIYFRYPHKYKYPFVVKCPYYRNSTYKEEFREPVKLQEQKLAPANFSIQYPFIDPLTYKGSGVDKVNNEIVNQVSELFKKQVLQIGVVDFSEVLGNYEIMLNKNGILSILFSMYIYVNRAAHGFTLYSSMTANVATGEIYSFSDLFNSKVYYKGFLDPIIKQYIKENNIDLINEYNGITENQKFYLTPDSLVVYYQIYEYTPYYYGLFKIQIPYNKIANIINPAGPIAKLMR